MPYLANTFATRRTLRWVPALLWMALIFWLSSLSDPGLPSGLGSPAHFGTYALLGALCAFAIGPEPSAGRAVALAVLISSAYGATDEFHQSFVPGRFPDVTDWGFDTLGALVGAVALVFAWRFVRGRRRS